jgi:anti-anti-sigma regulatory factor
MKFYLIVANGPKAGLPIPIDNVDLFVVGSDSICQLRPKSPRIGGKHCAFITRERKVFIRDMDSGENTVVNGAAMEPGSEWPLHAGDRIEVGPLEFMIQFSEMALSQRDLEEWALKCLDADAGEKKTALEELEERATRYTQKQENASKAAEAIIDKLSAARGVVRGRLRISKEGGVTIVRVNDVYLVEGSELAYIKKELHDNLALPNLRVLLDLKNVRRMSTTAANMIAEFQHWLRPWGSTIALCRLRPELKDVIAALPALKGVSVFPDKPTAIEARW